MKEKIKLFCVPYAGGSSIVYQKWAKLLDSRIELYPVELAGRGKRIDTRPYTCLNEVIHDVLPYVTNCIAGDRMPFLLFGHSMGAIIAYELTLRLSQGEFAKQLSGLIVSGKKPPHLALESIVQSVQSDNFKEEVLKLGGFPKEFAPVFQLFAPLLKSDLGLLQTYEGSNENYAIDCALHTFYGKEDKLMKEEEVEQWRRYCKNEGDFSFHSFEGGHFFIQEKQVQVIGAINTIADSAIKHYKNLGMGE